MLRELVTLSDQNVNVRVISMPLSWLLPHNMSTLEPTSDALNVDWTRSRLLMRSHIINISSNVFLVFFIRIINILLFLIDAHHSSPVNGNRNRINEKSAKKLSIRRWVRRSSHRQLNLLGICVVAVYFFFWCSSHFYILHVLDGLGQRRQNIRK